MSRVLSLLLVPPVHRAVKQRYRAYRRAGTPAFSAGLTTLMVAIGWLLLRFESPSWQKVQAGQSYWFPHISPHRPRPADTLRYLLQGFWLLVTHSGPAPMGRSYFAGWHRAMPTGCRVYRSVYKGPVWRNRRYSASTG